MTDGVLGPADAAEADDPGGVASGSAAIQRAALRWQVVLWSGEVTAAEQQAFDRWLATDPAHQQAWQRVRRVGEEINGVPGGVAGTVLRAAARHPVRFSRRTAVRGLALLAGTGLAAYALAEAPTWRALVATHHTGRGERRTVALPDGTRLDLNTGTAVDLRFTGRERRVLLQRGEILVTTAADEAHRPFVVGTREGDVRALGTRFTVRRLRDDGPGDVLVQVLEGATEIAPRLGGAPARIGAGRQVRFTPSAIATPTAADPAAAAWSRGILVAERQRLADFLAELGRYRSGILRCDPAVADLVVSGVYPLHDTDAILQSLAEVLPVRVRTLTHYWVTVTTP